MCEDAPCCGCCGFEPFSQEMSDALDNYYDDNEFWED